MKIFNESVDLLRRLYWHIKNYRIIDLRESYKLAEVIHLKKVVRTFDIDCIFDVGANYGQYALMLRKEVGYQGKIISFEPLHDAANNLRKISKDDPNWIIVEVAVSSQKGTQSFNVMRDSQFSSLSDPKNDVGGILSEMNVVDNVVRINTESLFALYEKYRSELGFDRPFLKMDTQGHDFEIVSHAKSVVRQFVGLQSELSIRRLYKDSVDFREALELYYECGFELSAFVPNNAGHFPSLIETDCIMLRSDMIHNVA